MNTAVRPKIVAQQDNSRWSPYSRWSRPAQPPARDAITLRLRDNSPEEVIAASSALASLVSAEGLPTPFVLTAGSEIIAAFVLDKFTPVKLDQIAKALANSGIRGEVRASRVMTSDTAEIAQMWTALRALTQPEALCAGGALTHESKFQHPNKRKRNENKRPKRSGC